MATTQETKPWYQSKTIIGAVVMLACTIGQMLGHDFSGEQENITNAVLAAGGVAGSVLAIIGRLTAKKAVE